MNLQVASQVIIASKSNQIGRLDVGLPDLARSPLHMCIRAFSQVIESDGNEGAADAAMLNEAVHGSRMFGPDRDLP